MDTVICPGCFGETPQTTRCARCGYEAGSILFPQALQPGTVLNSHYLVGKVLGKPGGFGITYLAWDNALETRIAIKEFMPHELVGRDHDHVTVIPHSREERTIFQYGLQSFLQEARTLARFSHHPNIVRVRHYFQENETAYMAMDYYEGQSLWEYLAEKRAPLSEKAALAIILPILDGLREIHDQGFVHRDIKPQNIYLTREGRPILLDFGAARSAIGEKSRSLSVVWTPGFAPFEQYQSHGKQGAWTDIYGVSATLYFMLTAKIPPDALERKADDSPLAMPGLSPAICFAVRKGLAPDADQRPQSIAEFRNLLIGKLPEDSGKKEPGPSGTKHSGPELRARPHSQAQPDTPIGLSIAVFAGIFLVLYGGSFALLTSPPNPLTESQTGLPATIIAGVITGIYWFCIYVAYRIGRKFSIGSLPAFAIPVYNLVLLSRCGGFSGWFVLVNLIPYIGSTVFSISLFGAIAQKLGKNFWLYGLGSLLGIPILFLAFDGSRPLVFSVENGLEPDDCDYLPPEAEGAEAVSLYFLNGDFQGETIEVPAGGIIIGRNPTLANIVFQNFSISGRHLRVSPLPNSRGKRIEDLGSTNGTYFSFSAPPTQWQRLAGVLEEREGNTVWIRIASDGPIIEIS